MLKNKNGIHLPKNVSDLIKKHLETREFQELDKSIFVSDKSLKTLIERSEDGFQGRRLKQLILEKTDLYTQDWLQDVHLGTYDYTQDLIFRP